MGDGSRHRKLISKRPKLRKIPLDDIRVKKQMRETVGFEEESLEDLADSIYEVGLLSLVIVNKKRRNKFPTLSAGERRFRAYQILHERYGREFSRIPCQYYDNLTEDQHRVIQQVENSYVPPDPAEAGRAYAEHFYALEKKFEKKGKKLSRRRFAKIVNRSESCISDALNFYKLYQGWDDPDLDLKILLEPDPRTGKSPIPYGGAVQIARLPRERRRDYMAAAILGSWNVKRITEEINAFFKKKEKEKVQTNLLEQKSDEALAKDFRITHRDVFGNEVIEALNGYAAFLKDAIAKHNLFVDGKGANFKEFVNMSPFTLDYVVRAATVMAFVGTEIKRFAKTADLVHDRYEGLVPGVMPYKRLVEILKDGDR
jgi:ParB/RepB/Spo0J family partition protein